jgi:hypothetical protein
MIKFVNFKDESASDQAMLRMMQTATVIVLCSKYESPEIKNVIRACAPTKLIYSVAENNVEKGVDTRE